MRATTIAILLLCSTYATAQSLTGVQEQPGYTFTIPEGWVGQRSGDGYVLVHEAVTGMLMVVPGDYADLAAMRSDLASPTEGEGTSMKTTEGPIEMGTNTLGVTQEGTMDGTEVRAVAIATWNASGGRTVNVAGLAPVAVFSEDLLRAMQLVHSSITYTGTAPVAAPAAQQRRPVQEQTAPPPAAGPIDQEWHERLSGFRLYYSESSSTPVGSGASGGVYGGYSATRMIHLCTEGYFKVESSSEHALGADDALSSVGSSSSSGNGTWSAIKLPDGRSILRLVYNDGGVREYRLEFEDGRTYLDGQRWSRTSLATDGPKYAADCP